MRFDLAIAYRVYPGISKAPAVHADDKRKLVEFSLASLGDALGEVRAKVFAILDGCPDDYEHIVRRALSGSAIEILRLNKEGNFATFGRQIRLLCEQDDAPYVYFAEDDYFYFPNAMREALGFMAAQRDAHFVTLFDHPDLYSTRLHRGATEVAEHEGRHWRTCASTCLTFLSSREVLRRTRGTFSTYTQGNHDASMWFALTKPRMLHPARAAIDALREPGHARIAAHAWRHSWPQILTGRRYRLWSPMPTLATHLESTSMAPSFDWARVFEKRLAESGGR